MGARPSCFNLGGGGGGGGERDEVRRNSGGTPGMIGGRNEDDLTCCALHVTPIRKASGNVRALNTSRLAGYSAAVKFHKSSGTHT